MSLSIRKNVSWERGNPKTEDVEHCHFFHSRDDKGTKDNTHATMTAGHTHQVSVEWDEAGESVLSMSCGPALKEVWKKSRGGREEKHLVPVRYTVSDDYGGGFVEDAHTHDLKYIHTQFLSKNVMEARRQDERNKISTIMDRSVQSKVIPPKMTVKKEEDIDLGIKA